MFRHQTTDATTVVKVEKKAGEDKIEVKEKLPDHPLEKSLVVENEASVKELLEKNLKWSQIIYEQNRKINNKLLWAAIGSWIKVFLIFIPLILAVILLAPIAKNLASVYSNFVTGGAPSTQPTNSLEQLMKLLPLNSAQQEQLKALIK